MKKIIIKYSRLLFTAVACLLLFLICLHCTVEASSDAGSCGAGMNWTLQDGILTISGSGDMDAYQESSLAPWNKYKDEITTLVVQDGVTSIGTLAFYDCSALEQVSISDSVSSIGDYAFLNCTSLKNLKLGSAVQSIGESAFERCEKLSSVKLPGSLTFLKDRAFYRCSSLGSIIVPMNVSVIGTAVFAYCESLIQAVIEPKIAKLPDWTFYGCNSLVSVTLSASVTDIGDYAFYDCGSFEKAYVNATEEKQQEIENIIKENVAEFESVQKPNTSDGNAESWRPSESDESQVVQKDVIETENTIVKGEISEIETGNQQTDYNISIDVTIDDSNNWDPVLDMLKDYSAKQGALENSNGDKPEIQLNVQMQNGAVVPGTVLDKLAGSKINLSINTAGMSYRIPCESLPVNKKIEDFDIIYTLTRNTNPTAEQRNVIGNSESYLLTFNKKGDYPISIIIPLGISNARMFTSLYEKPAVQSWKKVESSQIDKDGKVEFYFSSFDTVTEYMIALDVHAVTSEESYIPEGLYDEYGGLTDGHGTKYVITGTNSLFGLSFGQFGLAVAGVLIVTFATVGVTMKIVLKRKETLDKIRREAMGESAGEE